MTAQRLAVGRRQLKRMIYGGFAPILDTLLR